jgi:hypothetical protein
LLDATRAFLTAAVVFAMSSLIVSSKRKDWSYSKTDWIVYADDHPEPSVPVGGYSMSRHISFPNTLGWGSSVKSRTFGGE